jgi:hypothetical protein
MGVRLTMSDLVESRAAAREQEPAHTPSGPAPVGDLELGWDGVASGLSRILIGYCLMILQVIFAVCLIWYIIASLPTTQVNNINDIAVMTAILTAGFGAIALASLFSCIMIFTGKCRCAVNAPELGGARWLIFCCILCLAAGTLLGIATSILGPSSAQRVYEAKTQAELFSKLQPPTMQEIAAGVLNLTATVLFVLFLRAIGQRFESHTLTVMVDLYLFASAMVVGVSVQTLYLNDKPFDNLVLLLGLGIAWLVLAVWYVLLIVVARVVLAAELSRPRSSLMSR